MFEFLSQPSAYRWFFPTMVSVVNLNPDDVNDVFPSFDSLAPALAYALALSVLRLILQTLVFQPLAIYSLKLKIEPPTEPAVPMIDRAMRGKKKLNETEVSNISEKTGLTVEAVYTYVWSLRRRRYFILKVQKFVEAIWRFLFYTVFCIVGYYTLFVPEPVSWIQSSDNFWKNWPRHPITPAVALYYQLELGAYFHQLLWTEISRSDALEMLLHHAVTIILVVLSFLTNFTRIGTTILLLHDSADVFLESAKVFNYISKTPGSDWSKPVCDVLFGTFAVTFFVTRLIFFPRHILYSVIFTAHSLYGFSTPYFIFAVMLTILQLLHIFWFYLIARMIYQLIFTHHVEKDIRSDDEEELNEVSPPEVKSPIMKTKKVN